MTGCKWRPFSGAMTLTNGIFLEDLIRGNGVSSAGDTSTAPTPTKRKLIACLPACLPAFDSSTSTSPLLPFFSLHLGSGGYKGDVASIRFIRVRAGRDTRPDCVLTFPHPNATQPHHHASKHNAHAT